MTELIVLSPNRAILSYANGEIRYVDTSKMNVYKKIETLFTRINHIILIQNDKYMLVCGREPYISLIDLTREKNIMNKYITFDSEVKSMALVSEYELVVVLVDNKIVHISLPTPKQLDSLIMHGSFDAAYELVKKDPLLLVSKEYKNLENRYQEMLKRAIVEISQQNKAFAIQTLSFFEDVQVKKREIELVFKAFDNYKKLQELYFAKEYSKAYNLVAMYPGLESTREYKHMESEFKKNLQEATGYLKYQKYEQAQILLKKYILAKPKQGIIKLYLTKSHLFLDYLDLLKSKNISQIQALAQTNKVFAQCLKYLNIDVTDNVMKNNLAILDAFINRGKLLQAKKIIYDLDTNEGWAPLFPYKERVLCIGQLYALYEKKDYLKCYHLLDKYDFLSANDLVIRLEQFWKKMIQKVEQYAYEGNIKKVSSFVNKYKELQKREVKLKELLALSHSIDLQNKASDVVLTSANKKENLFKKLKIFN